MQADHSAVLSARAISLEKALRREKVLAEVLRIISRSQGDFDAVMSAITGPALGLCKAEFGTLLEHPGQGAILGPPCQGHPQTVQGMIGHSGCLCGRPARKSWPAPLKPWLR